MPRFKNDTTGAVVSVDESKADRFGDGWTNLDEAPAPKRRRSTAKSDSK